MGDTEAEKSAAVAVLNSMHHNYDVRTQPIEVWQEEARCFVIVTRKAIPFEIMLPGCVPKQNKVFERSEHPYAVEIKLALRRPPGGAEDVQDQTLDEKKRTYFVNPEFKTPKQKEVKAAVAEASGSGDAAVAAAAITMGCVRTS